ncbi:MAG: hypothetical protein JWM36_1404 [Hyphomicrobiales bacterium]|nr:hypothetical protein [Hyphomicrobiales bacterium]
MSIFRRQSLLVILAGAGMVVLGGAPSSAQYYERHREHDHRGQRPPVYRPPVYRPPNRWVGCARENGVCYAPYRTRVRYGSGGYFAQIDAAGPIRCDNRTFGDPTPGFRKACAYLAR